MYVEYFGFVELHYWEYVLMFFYLLLIYLYYARQKNMRIRTQPEYRYFLWGLFSKVLGGVAFSLIYFYYYDGGDTTAYFYSSKAMTNLMGQNFGDYLQVLFGDNTLQNRSLFTMDTGKPFEYIYFDDRAFMVVRLINPISIICMGSYLVTTVMVASLSFAGVWRLYRTLFSYYPRLHRQLAIAVLFMPSSILWGSAILKDTFTFSAFCWFIYAFDNFFFKKRNQVSALVQMILCSFLIVYIKPYIFMVLMPICLLWLSHGRISRMKNALVKFILLPIGFVVMTTGALVMLTYMQSSLGKFSLDSSLDTIMISQTDLKRSSEYGTNYFDVGEIDGTWGGVFSKAPIAISAAWFRPALPECHNIMMVFSGLENTFVLGLFLWMLWRTRVFFFLRCMFNNPLLLVCFLFAISYGFVTGITTPNYGALVRFKIPLLPLLVGGMYITLYLTAQREKMQRLNMRFDLADYKNGDPDLMDSVAEKRIRQMKQGQQRRVWQ